MYEIIRVEDVSRPRCKRYIGHIDVETNDKSLIKDAILSATSKIMNSDEYADELTKQRFDCPAHVVRLYIHVNGKLICQSMWVDKTLEDIPLPIPLKYNDSVGDIGIVW